MSWRWQLPVSSPVALSALTRAVPALLPAHGADGRGQLAALLRDRFGASAVVLTDSGTSALSLALRLAAGTGGTVAYPAWACLDLAAAAAFTGTKVRLYDLDPATLSPDLGSLEATLKRGVDAVVVAHLYGMPADVPGVARLAASYGARVIEDAAQGAHGRLGGTRLGGFGPLTVLSFGRGKGTSGGHGGALLAIGDTWLQALRDAAAGLPSPPAGAKDLAAAGIQWMLGRPGVYRVPSMIPGLRLGELVYHPGHEPGPLSRAAAALVRRALAGADAECAIRRRNAAAYARAAESIASLQFVAPISGGEPGFLRVPVLDHDGRRAVPVLGILRAYPLTLMEQRELRPCLHPDEGEHPGAATLRASCFTLPAHSMVSAADVARITHWIANGT